MFIIYLFFPPATSAQEQRAFDSLRICSMNIDMLGRKDEPKADKQKERELQEYRKDQLKFLVSRIKSASCDIVALQEIYGLSSKEANKNISRLAKAVNFASALRATTDETAGKSAFNKTYSYHVAKTNDKHIRNGYIYRRDLGKVKLVDMYRESVPTADWNSPSRRFARGPAVLSVEVASKNRSKPIQLYLINYHLKSKVSGWKDLSGLSYELNRVETAEAVKNIAKQALRYGRDIVIFLGDRNADTGSATDEVLSGKLSLDDFKGMCSIDKKFLKADCAGYKRREPEFIGVLANKSRSLYSYKYKKEQSLIDEIYINKNTLKFIKDTGVTGEYLKGSDHLLTWVEVGI